MISLIDILFGSVIHGPVPRDGARLPYTVGGGSDKLTQVHIFIDDDGVRTPVPYLYAKECVEAGTATLESLIQVDDIVKTFYTFHPPRSK